MKVILGTAHGSNVQGKRSPDGRLLEYKYSREICKLIQKKLIDNGIDTVIDIEDDVEKSLTSRVRYVNSIASKDDIYVSVHVDATGDGSKWFNSSGWSVRVGDKASNNSKKLALCLFSAASEYGVFGNRWIPETKYHPQNLYVCNATVCPAVLTENMFQDNEDDANFLLSDEGKEIISDIHVNGIMNYISSL